MEKELMELAARLIETAEVCRGCEWDVEKFELVQLLTSLEREAKEIMGLAGTYAATKSVSEITGQV